MPLLTSSEGNGEMNTSSSTNNSGSALRNHRFIHQGEQPRDDPTIMHVESSNGFSRMFVSKPSPYTEHSSSTTNRYAPSPTNSRPTVFSSKNSTPSTSYHSNTQNNVQTPSLSPALTLMNDAERPTSSLAINNTPGHFSAIKFQRQIPSLSPSSSPRANSQHYTRNNDSPPSYFTARSGATGNEEQANNYHHTTNIEKNKARSPSTNFAPSQTTEHQTTTTAFDPAVFSRRRASPTVFNSSAATGTNSNKSAVEEHHHYYYLANKEKAGQRMRRESPTLTPRDRELYITKSTHPFLSTISRANTTPTSVFTPPSYKTYDVESEPKSYSSGRLQSGISVGMKEIEISPRREKEDLIKQLLLSEKTDKAFKMAEAQQDKIKTVQNSYFTEEFATSDINPIKISPSKPKKTSIIFSNNDEGNTTDNEDREIVNILSQIKKSRTAINENTYRPSQITPKKEPSPVKQNISFGEEKQGMIDVNLFKQKEFSKTTLIDEIQRKNREIIELRNKIIKLHSMNTNLDSQNKSLEDSLEALQFISNSKDTAVSELNKRIDEIQVKLDSDSQTHANVVEGLKKTIENLNQNLRDKDAQVRDQDRQHLRPIIEEHNRTIRELRSDIERERLHYEEKKGRLLELIACKEDEIRKNGEKDKQIMDLSALIERKDQEIRTLKLFSENNLQEIDRFKKQTQHLLEERRDFTEQVREEISVQIKEGQTKEERINFLENLVEKYKKKLVSIMDENETKKQELLRIVEEERRISNSLRTENFKYKNNEKAFQQIDFIRRNISSTIKDVNNLLTLVETDGLETSQSKLFNQRKYLCKRSS